MKKAAIIIIRQTVRVLPLAYMGLIWFLSSYPSDALVNTGLSFDRALKEAMHLFEFGILYMLFVLALLTWNKLTPRWSLYAAAFSIFYGLLDEFHQYFVPARSANAVDFLKDLIGVTVAWLIVRRAYTIPESRVKFILQKMATKLGPPIAEDITE